MIIKYIAIIALSVGIFWPVFKDWLILRRKSKEHIKRVLREYQSILETYHEFCLRVKTTPLSNPTLADIQYHIKFISKEL